MEASQQASEVFLATPRAGTGNRSVIGRRDLDDAALARTACETARRALRPDEWERLVGTTAPDDLTCG